MSAVPQTIDARTLIHNENLRLRDEADQLFQRFQQNKDLQSLPTKRFLLISTPRTGSTFLSRQLNETRHLGWTHEWFNWGLMQQVCSRLGLKRLMFRNYLSFLDGAAKSSSGIYGVNIHIHQYQFLLAKRFDIFKKVHFDKIYWLHREDRIAQAYSWAKALKTRCWSRRAEEALGFPQGINIELPPSQVAKCLTDICANAEFYESTLKPTQRIEREFAYGELVADRCSNAVNGVLADFGKPSSKNILNDHGTAVQTNEFDRRQITALKSLFNGN